VGNLLLFLAGVATATLGVAAMYAVAHDPASPVPQIAIASTVCMLTLLYVVGNIRIGNLAEESAQLNRINADALEHLMREHADSCKERHAVAERYSLPNPAAPQDFAYEIRMEFRKGTIRISRHGKV
jgi:hypothetical protein